MSVKVGGSEGSGTGVDWNDDDEEDFSRIPDHRAGSYDFNDCNEWREVDGFLCRNDNDCQWMDVYLNCEDYELDFSPAVSTVKLGIKELLKKEQTGFKELFTDYQPFYTINLLLDKELLPI